MNKHKNYESTYNHNWYVGSNKIITVNDYITNQAKTDESVENINIPSSGTTLTDLADKISKMGSNI